MNWVPLLSKQVTRESSTYLLEQRLHTLLQQKGAVKLLGLDYSIQYKKGVENKVVDTLSRHDIAAGGIHQLSLSSSSPSWLQEVINSYDNDELASRVTTSLLLQTKLQSWSIHGGVLK